MNYKQHLFLGAAIFVMTIFLATQLKIEIPQQAIPLMLVVAVFASLFPDVDSQVSKINNAIELFLVGASIFLLYLYYIQQQMYYIFIAISLLIILIAIQLLKHRGIMHSFKVNAVISIAIGLVNAYLGVAFFIGYASHVLGDKVKKF